MTSSHGLIDLWHEMSQQGVLGLAGCIKITLDRGLKVEGRANRSFASASIVKNKIVLADADSGEDIVFCFTLEDEGTFDYKNKHIIVQTDRKISGCLSSPHHRNRRSH